MCAGDDIVLTLQLPAFHKHWYTTVCHNVACSDSCFDLWLWRWMYYYYFFVKTFKMGCITFVFISLCSLSFLLFLFFFILLILNINFSFFIIFLLLLFSPQASWVFLTGGFTDMCLPTTGWRTLITQSSAVQIFQTVSISDLNHWKLRSITYSW